MILAACGGGGGDDDDGGDLGPSTYSVGGSVTGLSANASVVLQNNGGNNLTVSANGSFTFSTALAAGAAYNVTVLTQPQSQTCVVNSGSGTMPSAAVTNVIVTCRAVGRFIYVPNALDNTVSAFSINATSGALTAVPGSPFPTDLAPALASADPAGKFLYVINRGSSTLPPTLSSYAINAQTGVLSENPASPFELTHVSPPPSLADTYNKPIIHPSGSYGYVTARNSGRLYGASADASGTLTEIPGMNRYVGPLPGWGTFDTTGGYLFVPYGGDAPPSATGAVAVFQFNAGSGVLTPAGEYQLGGARGPSYSALTPDNKFLLVANQFDAAGAVRGTLTVFRFSASSGTLSITADSPVSTAGGTTTFLVVHPTKNFVYANSNSLNGGITGFRINTDTGALTQIAARYETAGAVPVFMRIDPTGKFLYAGSASGTTIHGFAIDPTTGALTPVPGSPFSAGKNPNAIVMDPSGRFLYAPNSGSNSLSSFVIDPTTGSLTLVNTVATGNAPVAAEVVSRP